MNSKRLNPNNQDFHVIASLIQHYNPTSKKLLNSDSEIPEPELCPQPHNLSVNKNFLNVPNSNTADQSFRSLSSRNEHTRREHKKSADYSKRSSSPYTSPRTVFQDVERILIVEQQLKLEKEKYKKLEKKYKELMIAQSQNQSKFENMVQEMQKKIEERNSEKINPLTISKDIQAIKSQLLGIDQKFEFFIDYINSYK